MQSHYITASRHCITPSHYTTALRHRITPLRHNTRSTRSTAYTVGRRYKPISSHNRAIRHSRATLLPLNVPQQFCAAPSGNALPLFRRRNVRINPLLNKPGDSFGTLGRHYKPISSHNRAARHSRATLCHFFVAGESALIPSRISSETPSAPLGDITSLYRSTTEPCDILGRHYCPKTFPNRAVRYPWATLQAYIVPQQGRATLSGDISAPKRSPSVLRGTLGQHYSP